MKVYKIRHKKTGKFSTGGATPQFNDEGKEWSSLANVKKHLLQGIENRPTKISVLDDFKEYVNCEIVEFTVTYSPAKVVEEFLIEDYIQSEMKIAGEENIKELGVTTVFVERPDGLVETLGQTPVTWLRSK